MLGNLKRTHYCNDVAEGEVVVAGFCARIRDKGNLIFIDLRDRTGIVQLVFDDSTNRTVFETAKTIRSEFVLMAKGQVRARESVNSELKTGNIEVFVTEISIESKANTPPFEILPDINTKEDLRLKYRYLDLRRSDLQHNIIMRHKIISTIRNYYYENNFIEIETPVLIKSTPEGARDFLVPSRLHNGSFYALPQSPQLYKQLLMVAGFDRYIQIARCFRDEELRADRQPEFTQIDLEMSFVDMEDVLNINEGMIKTLFKTVMDVEIAPMPRLTYHEALYRYGSDKPDTRFDMELIHLDDIVKNCGFAVFENAPSTIAVTAKNASVLTRKEIDKLTEFVKGYGVKGLAWVRLTDDAVTSSFSKFVNEDKMNEIIEKCGAQKGDVILIVADKTALASSVMGALRLHTAQKLDIIPKDKWNFLWVTEFPFFEWDEENQTYNAMHHPFTSPLKEDIEFLDTDKGKVRAQAYDMVLNGVELSSGSIRITDPDLQKKMFYSLGFTDEQAEEKFGFLTNAFKYGAPPHGGMGFGLDRLVSLMLDCKSIRDVIAFPKVQNMSEPMTACPSAVDKIQLDELGIKFYDDLK